VGKRGDKRLVGKGTKIHDSANIEGSVIFGKNCMIDDGVLIREGCVIGDNVHIGHAVELKHCVIMSDTAIAHLNYIGDSIIGNKVNVGGGAIIANWRFDKKKIIVKGLDEKVNTNLEKFGAAIGDGSNIGVNAVLNPGTILGRNSIAYPLTSVRSYHPDNSIIK